MIVPTPSATLAQQKHFARRDVCIPKTREVKGSVTLAERSNASLFKNPKFLTIGSVHVAANVLNISSPQGLIHSCPRTTNLRKLIK